MVAVDSLRGRRIETAKLFELSLHDVLEGARQPRMKNHSTERMAPQACGNFLLAFRQAGGTIRRGERCRKIEVKTSVDSRFPRHCGGSFRILHENHGTDRGHRLPKGGLKNPVGRPAVQTPIVGVYDEETCV